MDYAVDKISGRLESGNNSSRVERNNYLTLEKRLDADKLGVSRKCPACGANMNINRTGKCEYCGTIFDTEDFDWVITDIESSI